MTFDGFFAPKIAIYNILVSKSSSVSILKMSVKIGALLHYTPLLIFNPNNKYIYNRKYNKFIFQTLSDVHFTYNITKYLNYSQDVHYFPRTTKRFKFLFEKFKKIKIIIKEWFCDMD